MATGVLYPTTDHISGDFTTGVHTRAEGQDVDPVAIRRAQLMAQLAELGVAPEEVETPEQTAARLKAELEALPPHAQVPGA